MLEFSQCIMDVPDILRFPTVHMLKTHFLLENWYVSSSAL